ncbi:Tetratricopeptide repeat-containing protein [Rhodovulum sp. ES.010]|uniref:tetratricopeptide repeat protein n=1 Tax=Rhodovulum sp. ES.010 TaxID=1882821 RepID=UPI00092B0E09|nr:tetratricopeptide repeat protein [Rhodovulum sp. ES.010]SIO12796.1 Tetratricopeptide repeat-containing protein [Rhodovulum sp. ES.010]
MGISRHILNAVVTAFLAAAPALADGSRAEALLDELQQPDLPNWKNVEDSIWEEWSRSGSAAMDLLLRRGREAVEEGAFETAIEHLTALTDHAPDFAEGYNARALAYFKTGRFGPAVADLARTLQLNPRHFGALMGLGAILEETGRYDAALEAYQRAHAIHPHDPDLEEAVTRLELMTSGRSL